MAAIQLAGVGKRFDATQVIGDISLDIADGEFCVLVGPSGSGKSTLLRLIAGLEAVSSGSVHIGGRDVTHHAPKDRDIAMVFQSYALYPQMTVRENMGFGLKLLKRPAEEIKRRVDDAARILDLEALMERRPAALSGGQRQRVAMGRAMVRQPAAFLFDEPLSNLDAALRATVRGEIRAMHARSKTTSVYVTHDQVEAMTMGDRIVVLRGGHIEQVGTPVELYERPLNRFVANFIGSPAMNFCELAVQRDGLQCFALLGQARLPLPVERAGERQRIVLGVRPEHLHLGPREGDVARLTAEVLEIEFTGAQSQVRLGTAAGALIVSAADRPELKPGDTVTVGLAAGRLHFFDVESGLRLVAELEPMKPVFALLLTAVVCGALGCAQRPARPEAAPIAASTPALLTLEPAALALTRQRLESGDASLQAPFAALKRRADRALLTTPRSVTHKTSMPPSGSKNDYMSMGPYWWPNPATPDGLPYVQRDGQRNPQSTGNALDSIRMQAMLADTRDLALAHYFTGDPRYAHKAAAVIRTWFLDPATRMNPNLRYGQGIPGIVDGRGIGIIDTRDLWLVIDAVALIAPGALSAAEVKALRRWFADYAEWLDTSPLGRDEAAAQNNHGLFFDVQLAACWLFIGETERARKLVFDARTRRFAVQIDTEGRMPLELARTRPFHYHTFTLEAATRLARYGQLLEVDLWGAVIDGKSLRAVLNVVAGTVVDPGSWRHATALEPNPPLAPALPVLLIAQRAYSPHSFDTALARLKNIAPDDVAWLMWPVP